MVWFQNLKTAQKLFLSLGTCLFLSTIMGVVSITRMSAINDASDRIADGALIRTGLSASLNDRMRQYRLLEYNELLETDVMARSKAETEEKECAAKIEEHLADYEKYVVADVDRRNIQQVKEAWETYMSRAGEQSALSLNKNIRGGFTLMKARREDFSAVAKSLETLLTFNRERGKSLAEEATGVYRQARSTVIVLLAVNILLGITGVLFITRMIVSSLNEMTQVADALSAGDTSREVTCHSKDEIGSLAEAFRTMTHYMRDAATAASTIAQGNLAVTVTPKSDKDTLGNALSQMIGSLSKLIANVRVSSDSIAAASEQVASGNQDLSQRTEEQAASLEETAASMEEMTSTVKQNADNSRQANQLATQARSVAEAGGQVVGNAVTAMAQISEGSKKVADIVTVIDEIAFQTNLLALNAAVEAARVGEQGKGFAVVAAEVRSLASRSATAAKEIKALVQETVSRVDQGTDLVNASGARLTEIVSASGKVADIIADISAASVEQSSGIEQVNKAVVQMDQVTQQNAALVEESTAAAASMKEQAHELQTLVSRFTVDGRYLSQVQSRSAARPALREATNGRTARPAPAVPSRPTPKREQPRLEIVKASAEGGFEEF